MLRVFVLLSLLASGVASATLCPTVVTFASSVRALTVGNGFLSRNGRLLRAAARSNRTWHLFQFELVKLDGNIAVREKLTNVVILPLKQDHLLYYIPGVGGHEGGSVISEVAVSDAPRWYNMFSSRCDFACQGKLSNMFGRYVLPRYLPTLIDQIRTDLSGDEKSLSFDDFGPLLQMIAKYRDLTRDATYHAELPGLEGKLVTTPIQLDFRFVDDFVFDSNGGIRIPVGNIAHARQILSQLALWMGVEADVDAWNGGLEDFKFGNNLRANLCGGSSSMVRSEPCPQDELSLFLNRTGQTWTEQSDQGVILRQLFEALFKNGKLKKLGAVDSFAKTQFVFEAWRDIGRGVGVYDPHWGITLTAAPNGNLRAGINVGETTRWTQLEVPSRFRIWEELVWRKAEPSHLYDLNVFVAQKVLQPLFPAVLVQAREEIKKHGKLTWDQFLLVARWMDWDGKRSRKETRTTDGGLYKVTLPATEIYPGVDQAVRINGGFERDTFSFHIGMEVAPDHAPIKRILARFEVAMSGLRTSEVSPRPYTHAEDTAHVARFRTRQGLVGDVYDPNVSIADDPFSIFAGFDGRAGDLFLDLYPATGKAPLSPSPEGERWKRLLEVLIGEGQLSPL